MGGLVVALHRARTPFKVYQAIFERHRPQLVLPRRRLLDRDAVQRRDDLVPWDTASVAARTCSRRCSLTTPIILTGARGRLRVPLRHVQHRRPGPVHRSARSSRVWVGSSLRQSDPVPARRSSAIVVGDARRRDLGAGIAGILKATVGAHEVISTIMLNWIAIWVGAYPVRAQGGRCRTTRRSPCRSRTTSSTSVEAAGLLGRPRSCRGSTIGIFIALAACSSSYWIILNRTTLGYEVRAVGFNPEAARYGGISVARNYFLAMAIAGTFAGLARRDRHHSAGSTGSARTTSTRATIGLHRHRGRAPRTEHGGRRRALRAPVRRALINGTSTRSLDPDDLPARPGRRT